VVALATRDGSETAKLYVSCWNDASIAVVNPGSSDRAVNFIPVERHPTAMVLNNSGTRLFVVNSDADSVSVIDTKSDRQVERIDVRLNESALIGGSPESLCLSPDGATLYVANAHSNSVAVIELAEIARGEAPKESLPLSRVRGFIPTGAYP